MSQPMYHILQDNQNRSTQQGLVAALESAREMLASMGAETPATFGVATEDRYLLAVFTNRRITGRIVRQVWGGRKGDDAIFVGEDQFDATDAVLRMAYPQFLQLEQFDEAQDELGRHHIPWDGPCYVDVLDSICDYFGVDSLTGVTPEAFAYAQRLLPPEDPPVERTLVLSVKVRVRMPAKATVDEFLSELDYSIKTQTPGITVLDTELLGEA